MNLSRRTMTKVEDFLETIVSKHTRKNYVAGIKKFEQWYPKSIVSLIKSPKATKEIEKFYVHLREHHPQNTCRNFTNSAIQFLKYFGTDVRPRRALGIYRTELSTKNHRLTIDEIQRMANVANLKEQVILETLLLGFRISDVIRLKKRAFDVLEQETPIPLRIRARKEGTIYETFISEEFKDLLKLYLPTLKGEWLFEGTNPNQHTKDKTLNRTLQKLAKRANVVLHGSLTWHCGRKLVIKTGSELGLNIWIIKKMVGKSIQRSDETYLSDVKLKEGFLKLHSVLRLKRTNGNGRIDNVQKGMDLVFKVLRKMVEKELANEGIIIQGSIPLTDEELLKVFLKEMWK